MPTLANPKHERFAQERAKGVPASEAYVRAGYAKNDSNAARLNGNELIAVRVAELLGRSAVRAEISVASLTTDLLRLAKKAEALGDAAGIQASRASIMDAAKLNGLIVDKSEVTPESVQRVLSDKPQTDEEWAQAHGADLGAAAGAATRPN